MPAGDVRLADARVHIGGTGRVGTAIALALQTAGVGHMSCNDPQICEEEQLGCFTFYRRGDVGQPKVHVLERFFDGRHGFIFEPVVAPNESPKVRPYLERADVIVSCANRLSARLYLEHAAITLKKPSVQASAQDGRRALGGLVSAWVPDADCSCFGCLLPDPNLRFPRGEVLSPTVTAAIGSIAAQRIVDLITSSRPAMASWSNVLLIDLTSYAIEKLSVRPRKGCRCCGR